MKKLQYKSATENSNYNQKQTKISPETMKTAFSLAMLALAANACKRLERRINSWTRKAENRIDNFELRLEGLMASYTKQFNSDTTNSARVDDITAEELASFM